MGLDCHQVHTLCRYNIQWSSDAVTMIIGNISLALESYEKKYSHEKKFATGILMKVWKALDHFRPDFEFLSDSIGSIFSDYSPCYVIREGFLLKLEQCQVTWLVYL